MTQETLSIIIQFVTLGGVAFAVYKVFRDPDIKADKSIDLLKEQILYERKITDKSLETQQNCIKSLETQVKGNGEKIGKMNDTIIKLTTIIEERIPKKTI